MAWGRGTRDDRAAERAATRAVRGAPDDWAGRAGRGGGHRRAARLRRGLAAALVVVGLGASPGAPSPRALGQTAGAEVDGAPRLAAQDAPPRFDAPAAAPAEPAACPAGEGCAASAEPPLATVPRPSAPLQVSAPPSQGAGAPGVGAPGAADDLQRCPGGPALVSDLRTRAETGPLVLGARQSAVAALVPDAAALARLVARLRGGEPVEPSDALGWLLTQREAPRYPDNPLVAVTRDGRPNAEGGASYEALLADRLARGEGPIMPATVLQMALDGAGGDYPLAALTAHNLLKELTFASRDGTGALVGWSAADRGSADAARALTHADYVLLTPEAVQDLAAKLADLRPADDPRAADRLGPWHRLFALLLGGAVAGGPTPFGPEAELLASRFGPEGDADPFQDQMTACGTRLAAAIAALASPPAAPAPVAAAPPGPAPAPPPADGAGVPPPFSVPAAAMGAPASSGAQPGAFPPGAASGAAAPAPTPVPNSPFAAPAAADPNALSSVAFYPTAVPYQAPLSYPTPIPNQPLAVSQPQAPLPTALPTAVVVTGITGVVRNAQTGQPLAGATVAITSAGRTATTDASGAYQLTGLTPGSAQVSATATGFIADAATVAVPASGNATQNFGLSQSLAAGQFRIVLTWANSPRDLDGVLYVPGGAGGRTLLDYHNRSTAGATVDADDRDGAGPETITINQVTPGRYTYAVHQYSVSGQLASSGARVRILRGDSEVRSFTVAGGTGRWWTVFDFDGATGAVTPVNTLSNQAPTR